jgi:hypothetical protein
VGERRYSSYSFLTSALDGGEWSASRPGHTLAPGKGPPVPTVQEAEWAPEPVWTQRLEEQSSCLCRGSNLGHRVVQPIARHYTDWASQLTMLHVWKPNIQINFTTLNDCLLDSAFSPVLVVLLLELSSTTLAKSIHLSRCRQFLASDHICLWSVLVKL